MHAGGSDQAESKNSVHVPAARGLLELKENSAQLAEQKSQSKGKRAPDRFGRREATCLLL